VLVTNKGIFCHEYSIETKIRCLLGPEEMFCLSFPPSGGFIILAITGE
jgi:hypothetical protein